MMLMALAAGVADSPGIVMLCAVLTVGLLGYTFYIRSTPAEAQEKSRLAFLRERKETVYENLRDLNFEYRTGKFPESDYQQMRAALEEEAAGVLAEIDALEAAK